MRTFLRNNGLSVVLFTCFAIFLGAQSLTGFQVYNDEQREHAEPTIGFADYLASGHFIEATFENWESEFLQMGVYVLLTAYLVQRGSAESNDPDAPPDEPADDAAPEAATDEAAEATAAQARANALAAAPWPVRRGGLVLVLYRYSLASALLLLFLLSFVFHALGGAREYSAEQVAYGQPAVTLWEFLGTSHFWFQSFQNWQSEFLAVGMLVVLSIFLRQAGSPESKPVAAPHSATGTG